MTLLTKGLTFYYLCLLGGHRFQRAKSDVPYCPRCGGTVRLYGLKDSTYPAEELHDD